MYCTQLLKYVHMQPPSFFSTAKETFYGMYIAIALLPPERIKKYCFSVMPQNASAQNVDHRVHLPVLPTLPPFPFRGPNTGWLYSWSFTTGCPEKANNY
jgi:hypothetical protein